MDADHVSRSKAVVTARPTEPHDDLHMRSREPAAEVPTTPHSMQLRVI